MRILTTCAFGILAVIIAGRAAAEPVAKPASTEACMKTAFDLAQSAETKSLPEADYKKLTDLMSTLEAQCDASDFDGATTTATTIKDLVASAQ